MIIDFYRKIISTTIGFTIIVRANLLSVIFRNLLRNNIKNKEIPNKISLGAVIIFKIRKLVRNIKCTGTGIFIKFSVCLVPRMGRHWF